MKAKAMLVAALRRDKIFEEAYPLGTVRQLIWFEVIPPGFSASYMTQPVICDSKLSAICREIEKRPNFRLWGLNPWTGEHAHIEFTPSEEHNRKPNV